MRILFTLSLKLATLLDPQLSTNLGQALSTILRRFPSNLTTILNTFLIVSISSITNPDANNMLESLPFPRIDIRQNLGQPESKISSATLWLSGNWHAITLDGTPDGQYTNQVSFSRKSNQLTLFFLLIEAFERASRESASELKSAFERLKHS